ncbi:hypothetical protein GEMRC1_008461 [Eukaryota sp. GEM-RC1]
MAKLQELNQENDVLKHEQDDIKREGKMVKNKIGNKDLQLNRALETVERLQAKLVVTEQELEEERKCSRAEVEDLRSHAKHLKKQRDELIEGLKKQQQLIQVLRKQKVHLEASRLLELTAEEWSRIVSLPNK